MTFRPKHSKWDKNLYNPRRDDEHPSHWKFVAFSAFLAIFVDVFFNKISCYFCDFCEIFGLLEGLLCLFSKKLPPLAKKLVRSTCSKSIGAIKFLVTSAFFFFFYEFSALSRASLPFFFISLSFYQICYSCYPRVIFSVFFSLQWKIRVTFAVFAKLKFAGV